MSITENLQKLGHTLPEISTPGGNYVSVNIRENQAFIAIQFPILNGEFKYQGRLGGALSTKDGIEAMELCALNALTQVNAKIGFDKVEGLNHLDIYFQADDNWDDSPKVADGASDLFVLVLGDKGKHSRAIVGAHSLARNFCVGLTCSFTLIEK